MAKKKGKGEESPPVSIPLTREPKEGDPALMILPAGAGEESKVRMIFETGPPGAGAPIYVGSEEASIRAVVIEGPLEELEKIRREARKETVRPFWRVRLDRKKSSLRLTLREPLPARIPMPVSPPLRAAIQAIYAGGPGRSRWTPDTYGRPHYSYEAKDGRIVFFFEEPPDPESSEPVLALWRAVEEELSTETADVLLILLSRLADLPESDPHGIATISWEEMAEYRDRQYRHGRVSALHEDFERNVKLLASLRLSMRWKDYGKGGEAVFGEDLPDRLIDVVDWRLPGRRGFSYRAGQALTYYLGHGKLRWVGYYARALLLLNPRQDALAKKVGTFWNLTGVVAGKKGDRPRASIAAILDFAGEEPNRKNPNRTVDSMIGAHHRLQEIGLLEEIPDLEPTERHRGYFQEWLERPRTVKLSEDVWKIAPATARAELPSPRRSRVRRRKKDQPPLPFIPEDPETLRADPSLIRRFRDEHNIHQMELARALGISRGALSRYENRHRALPLEVAEKVADLWRQKAR